MKQLLTVFFIGLLFHGFGQLDFDKSNQLLWEINRKDLSEPSYIYGTLHLNDARLFEFTDSVYYAFYKSKNFALEVDVHELFDLFNLPLNANLLVDASNKIYPRAYRSPSTNGYGSSIGWPQFLDAYFYQIAINSGKNIFALETVEDQINAFQSVEVSKGFRKQPTTTEQGMIEIYLAGNLMNLQKVIYQGFHGSTGYNDLIVKRNKAMTEKIDSVVRLSSTFIAVGAGHLAGKEGLLNNLRKKGYNIRPIGGCKSADFQQEKQFFKTHHSSTFIDTMFNFSAKFGMYPKITRTENYLLLESRDLGQGNSYLIEVENNDLSSTSNTTFLKENFFQPVNATLEEKEINATRQITGIVEIEEVGLCWKRIIITNDFIYKLTSCGSLPFLNSNRSEVFFNNFKLLK